MTSNWLFRRWLSFPSVDLGIVVLVVGIHAIGWQLRIIPWSPLSGVPPHSRPALYGSAAIVVSLTGTLASVAIGQYLGGRGDRVKRLKELFPRQLARTWRGIFVGSVVAAVLFLTAYGLDSRSSPDSMGPWVFEIGATLAVARFARLAVLFGEIINLIVLDDIDPLVSDAAMLTPELFSDHYADR